MACVMLANQFAAGLRQEIKVKVAGIDGTFDKLLSIVKFEEAKLRDIVPSGASNMRKFTGYSRGHDHQSKDRGVQSHTDNQKHCFNCNATRHFTKNCLVRGRAAPVDSQRTTVAKTVNLTTALKSYPLSYQNRLL